MYDILESSKIDGKPNWRLYKARQRQRQKNEVEKNKEGQKKQQAKHRMKVRQAKRAHIKRAGEAFPSRMAKKRALDLAKESLPATPAKKAALVAALIESPTTRGMLENMGHVRSPEEEEDAQIAAAAFKDVSTALQTTKRKRSNDARAAVNVGMSLLCGEAVSKARLRTKVAKKLSINRGQVSKGVKHRTRVLRGEKHCWTLTERRTCSDTFSAEVRKLAHNFWASPLASRRTGNKKDSRVRKRLGPNLYVTHEKQILEMTQTEAFLEFKKKNPNLKMGQRTFEKCKPFFVIAPRAQDRNSCCCKIHVEMRMIFKTCMDYRRTLCAQNADYGNIKVYERLSDMVGDTLCSKEDEKYHNKACLSRSCENCGVDQLELLNEELDNTPDARKVKWQKFEYVKMKLADGQEKRKLQLVVKETAPGELFQFLKSLLKGFPLHQFRASWQHEQLGRLLDNLPQDHVCCIHDYSENFSCSYQNQVQSLYFSQTQASIHVTVLHRHALQDIDGIGSSWSQNTSSLSHQTASMITIQCISVEH